MACAAFLAAAYPVTFYQDRASEDEAARNLHQQRVASKTKVTCPDCGTNAWGKPSIHLICGDCQTEMKAATPGNETTQTSLQAEFKQAIMEQSREAAAPTAVHHTEPLQVFIQNPSLALG